MRNSTHPLLAEFLTLMSFSRDVPDTDGASLARILAQLTEHEIEEGGPYALTPGGTLEDADLGLNAAIAVFLGTHDVRLPKLDAFLDRHLASGTRASGVLDEETLTALLERDLELRNGPVPSAAPAAGPVFDAHEEAILEAIRHAARARFSGLPDTFTENAQAVIERTMRGNPDKQMSLMALYMRDALGKEGKRFTDEHLAEFGLANIFFWTAFIIYDDFWDEDEAAEPRLLPVANLFARHYTRFFENVLPHTTGFSAFFHELMDKLDAANEWEMLFCRLVRDGDLVHVPEQLPHYGDHTIKFYPAAGHVLGPVAMLVEQGFTLDSDEIANLIDYFKHYLIAMQLNDDAHDWKEDLARGHISTAVAPLLRAWQEHHPERTVIDLEADMPELERLFWFEVLKPLCEDVLLRTDGSRKALRSLDFIKDARPLEEFITRNEGVAREALGEQRRSMEFLDALTA